MIWSLHLHIIPLLTHKYPFQKCSAITQPELLHFALATWSAARMPSSFQTLLGLFRWTTFRPAAQLRNRLVKLDVPPPLLPNELLLQIIYILQSNGDEKSQGTLYSFLHVSRTCYSMAFRALYQCPYVTVSNCHRFKRSLVKFKNGSMVKRLHLRRLADRRGVEVLIIQECKDGLEEFVAVGAS